MSQRIQIPNFISISNKTTFKCNFDDIKIFQTSNHKISGFKVGIKYNQLCGISFLYKQNGGRAFYGKINQKNDQGITYYDFIIDDDDFIQILFGCYKDKITQIGVITYKGKQAIFGKDLGQQFKYMFMGFTFTAAFGFYNYEGEFEQLGFRVQKLPKEYLCQFFSPLAELLYPNEFNNINFNNNLQQNQPLVIYLNIKSNNIQQPNNQGNYGKEINQGKKYGIQNVMIISTEIKKQNQQPIKKQDDDDSLLIGNVQCNLGLVCTLCFITFLCCKYGSDNDQGERKKEYRQ